MSLQYDIEQCLKSSKFTSISEIVTFIVGVVDDKLSENNFGDIITRVEELQRPKGLDSVMLEEVKALIEAMFEQKQEDIIARVYKEIRLFQSCTSQNQRPSAYSRVSDQMNNRLDERVQKLENSLSKCHLGEPSSQRYLQKTKRQISQLKNQLDTAVSKKQFTQFKMSIQKQLADKITIVQSEKIVEKFERSLLAKLNQGFNQIVKLQFDLRKHLSFQTTVIKKQLLETLKSNENAQKFSKMEKRLSKLSGKVEQTPQLLSQMQKNLSKVKKEAAVSNSQYSSRLRNVEQNYLKQVAQLNTEFRQLCRGFESIKSNALQVGSWISETKCLLKNQCICWQKQPQNYSPELFKYETNKTEVIATEGSCFLVQSQVLTNTERPPELLLDQQPACRFIASSASNIQYGRYCLREIIKTREGAHKFAIKADNQERYSFALLRITKIA